MTTEETTTTPEEEEKDELAALTEMLNIAVLAGVLVIPLILPLPETDSSTRRVLLAKFQINDTEDEVVFGAMVPLDVITMLSCNFLKACATAFQNVGEVKEQELLFAQMTDLQELISEARSSLALLERKFGKKEV